MLKKLLLPSLLLLTLLMVGWLRFSPAPSKPVDQSPDEKAARPMTSSQGAHGASVSESDTSSPETEAPIKDEAVRATDQAQPSQQAETGSDDAEALTLTGLVTNQEGQPLPGVRIYCKYAEVSPGMTQSDANGAFQLKYPFKNSEFMVVFAQKEGYALYWLPINTVASSHQLDITLKDYDSPIHGKVTDENNLALADVAIAIPQRGMDMFELPLTKTDRDGRFQVELSPYFRVFQFSKTGFQTRIENLASPENDERIVVLKRPTRLEGVVIDNDTREPISWFSIWIAGDDDAAPQWFEFEDSEGRFSIPNLAQGSPHQMTVAAQGFLPRHVKDFLPQPDDPGVIVLKRGPANFQGHVVDSSNNPVSDVEIKMTGFPNWVRGGQVVQASSLTREQHDAQGRLALTYTDDEGYFELTPIPPDYDVELEMSKPGYATHYWPFIHPRTLQNKPEPSWILYREAAVRLTLNRDVFPGKIFLELGTDPNYDADQPIMHDRYASVSLAPHEADYLFAALPPGRYHLKAYSNNKLLADEDLNLKEGDLKEILLSNLYKIQGVAMINRQPLARGTVYLHQESQNQWRIATTFKSIHTDEAGRFAFEEVPSGPYRLFASPGHTSYRQNPFVSAYGLLVQVNDADVNDPFDFPRFGSLRARFKGFLIQDLMVSNQNYESRPMTPDANGVFVAHDLAPGNYVIHEHDDHQGHFPLVERVTMPEDGSDVDLGLIDRDDNGSLRLRFYGHRSGTRASLDLTRAGSDILLYRQELTLNTDITIPDISAGQVRVALMVHNSAVALYFENEKLDPFELETSIYPGTETTLDIEIHARVAGDIRTAGSWNVRTISLAGDAGIEVLDIEDKSITRGQYLTYYRPDQDSLNDGYTKIGNAPEGNYHITIDYNNQAGEPRQAQQAVQLIAGEYVRLQFDD